MLNPKDTSVGGGGGLDRHRGLVQQGRPRRRHVVLGRGRSEQAGRRRERSRTSWGPTCWASSRRKAGIGHADASSVLASVLPELVNQMTPQGQVPQGNALDGVLGVTARAARRSLEIQGFGGERPTASQGWPRSRRPRRAYLG